MRICKTLAAPHGKWDSCIFTHLVLPSGLGDVQTVSGLGLLALFFLAGMKSSRVMLAGSAAASCSASGEDEWTPDNLLEPYLWRAAIAAASPWSKLKSWLFRGLTVQAFGVAASAAFAAAMPIPGAFTL